MSADSSSINPETTLSHGRLRILIGVVVLSVILLVWQFGNPLEVIKRLTTPITPTFPGGSRDEHIPPLAERQQWDSLLGYGSLPVQVIEKGRTNPFAAVAPTPTPLTRDEARLRDLRRFTTALHDYETKQGQYPSGTDIVLGSESATCLLATGWAGPSACTGATNIVFAPVPADPGGSAYLYSGTNATFSLQFTLETTWGHLLPGEKVLTPTGIVSK